MANIGILGYGIVGSGVAEVIRTNRSSIRTRAGEDLFVKKILDIRDFSNSPDRELLTKEQDDVFGDSSIRIVVETIGGTKIAYEFTKKALQMGKHVVTSNKELVATHGPELLKLADENNVCYLFEASVGGGIPIIRPLGQCLAANEITGITGILNGTTNYILTRMNREGVDFHTALKEAQQNGYAESDPSADIEGHDACRKIAILSSIAYNEYVDYRYINTEGICNITLADMRYAEAVNSTIKLIAESRRINGRIYARVGPALVNKGHPLANVNDVFNGIVVNGNAIGEAMFYGRGAGKLPTASAVVADIIDIVKHDGGGSRKNMWQIRGNNVSEGLSELEYRHFIRLEAENCIEVQKFVDKAFENTTWIKLRNEDALDEIGFVTDKCSEMRLNRVMSELKDLKPVKRILNIIRFLDI